MSFAKDNLSEVSGIFNVIQQIVGRVEVGDKKELVITVKGEKIRY